MRHHGRRFEAQWRFPHDPEVVAKAQRRKFTAEYKLGIVEEADHATDPGGMPVNLN
jgi:hypothetical protein